MATRWILAAFAALAAFNAFALEIETKSYPSVHGAQIFVLDGSYYEDYDRLFEDLKAAGSDTLFIRVFHNSADRTHMGVANNCGSGVYFATDYTCVVYDMTADLAAAGERHGVSVYAWMATRSLSFLKTPENMSLSFLPDGSFTEGYGANILMPDVRETILELFTDLAKTGVDGILLQDDFIFKQAEGADSLACGLYSIDTGKECTADVFFEISESVSGAKRFLRPKDEAEQWFSWKATQLFEFLMELRSAVRLVDPSIRWAANVYYETPVTPNNGLAWYAQDINLLIASGVDYLAVMVYQDQIMDEMQFNLNMFLDYVDSLSQNTLKHVQEPSRALFKIQVHAFDAARTPLALPELRLMCNRAEREGIVSFVQLPLFSPSEIVNACGF